MKIFKKQRNLIRFRKKLVGDLNRSKNRLKSLLKYQGINIPEQLGKKNNWSYNFMNWVEEEAKKDVLLQDTLLLMLEEIKLLRQLLLKTERALRKLMQTRYNDKAKLLMSCSWYRTHNRYAVSIGNWRYQTLWSF